MDTKQVEAMAKEELYQEQLRKAIDREKERLTAQRWWHKLLPFKIVIIRR